MSAGSIPLLVDASSRVGSGFIDLSILLSFSTMSSCTRDVGIAAGGLSLGVVEDNLFPSVRFCLFGLANSFNEQDEKRGLRALW